MVRVVICSSSLEKAQCLFEKTQRFIKQFKIRSELSFCTDYKYIVDNFSRNIYHYDIYVLDISDDMAFKMSKAIREYNYLASLVFVSDTKRIKQNIFRYRPSGYIDDYNSYSQLETVLKHVFDEQTRLNPYFNIRNKGTLMRIHYNDILYLESCRRIVTIHTDTKKIEFYAQLSDVLFKLPKYQFIRCHQSYIVNLKRIKELNKTDRVLVTENGEKIKISERYYSDVISVCEKMLK